MSGVSNLAEVLKSIEDAKKLAIKNATQAVHQVAGDVLVGCVEGTPEDTSVTIGDWQVGLGSAPSGTLDQPDPGGVAATASGIATIETATLGTEINIVNNQPHIAKLNAGSAKKKPAGWIEASIDRATARLR